MCHCVSLHTALPQQQRAGRQPPRSDGLHPATRAAHQTTSRGRASRRTHRKMQKLTPNIDGRAPGHDPTWEDDLLYALPARTARKCARRDCSKTELLEPPEDTAKRFAACAKCQTARRCSRECQIQDWKKGGRHKRMCPQLIAFKNFDRDQKRRAVIVGCPGKVELYAFPSTSGKELRWETASCSCSAPRRWRTSFLTRT